MHLQGGNEVFIRIAYLINSSGYFVRMDIMAWKYYVLSFLSLSPRPFHWLVKIRSAELHYVLENNMATKIMSWSPYAGIDLLPRDGLGGGVGGLWRRFS